MRTWDAVVEGGGPAGCVTAMLLARAGCSVALIEEPRTEALRIGETLPPQALPLLADMGLAEAFQAQGHLPSEGIVSVWGSGEPLVNDFVFSPRGNGWHIDRGAFNAMLREAAAQAGCQVFPRSGATLRSGIRIDARGRISQARLVFDRLVAVAGLSAPRGEPSGYTLIEAVDEGWFYSALLPCGRYVVSYMTDGDIYAAGRRGSKEFFANQLRKARYTAARVAGAPAVLHSFSAVSGVKTRAAGEDWLAVGDAARSYDPLSGLGICTALRMADQAAHAALEMRTTEAAGEAAGEAYDEANRRAFASYRETHRAYYAVERRWPESEFWKRRAGLKEESAETHGFSFHH